MAYSITPQQTLSVARKAGLTDADLHLADVAVLTFNKPIIDRLEELCGFEDATWIGQQHHPYSAPRVVKKGIYEGFGVAALVPPMGASPLSCVIEDLVACGVKCVYLACACWSLGEPVQFGDMIVPEFSVGRDGTSIHYGNRSDCIEGYTSVVNALAEAARERGATVHVGGNASCEALYRISSEMAEGFRKQGCLCVENGEASTVFAVCKTLGIRGGVLFQPYIDLTQGWNPDALDERYGETGKLQGEVLLDASVRLREQGSL